MAKELALTTKEFNINHYEPLHYAAIKGDLNMYKFIHNKLEDKNPKNVDGWMPIHFASRHGKIRIVEFIIGHLEDKNPKDNSGLTPLSILAANGHLDVFKCIAKYGENLNLACADETTPLHIAAANRNVDICNFWKRNLCFQFLTHLTFPDLEVVVEVPHPEKVQGHPPMVVENLRVQRVHHLFAHADFVASSTMCTRCFETQSSPGCTYTRRSKFLTHSLRVMHQICNWAKYHKFVF